MGTIVASNIINRARKIFQDDTGIRWQDTECLDWLNDGQREIVLLKPDANVVNETMVLAAGTKQTIPATGIRLIDVVRNKIGVAQADPGKVVRLVDREVLDSTIPTWHSDAAAGDGQVDHYIFDSRDPKTFYVYPQAPGTNGVELIYSASPADVAAVGDAITLDDIYSNALLDYILYRAYSKDADYSGDDNRAANHYKAFGNSLGLKLQADVASDPNRKPKAE